MTTVPDVIIATEPPPLGGVAFAPIGVYVKDPDFVGLLTVTYGLSCQLPDLSRSSVEYDFLLYVGIPIPPAELAATGSHVDLVPIGAGALAVMVSGLLLVRRRVIRTARIR